MSIFLPAKLGGGPDDPPKLPRTAHETEGRGVTASVRRAWQDESDEDDEGDRPIVPEPAAKPKPTPKPKPAPAPRRTSSRVPRPSRRFADRDPSPAEESDPCDDDALFYENARDGNCLFECFGQMFHPPPKKARDGPWKVMAFNLRQLACDYMECVRRGKTAALPGAEEPSFGQLAVILQGVPDDYIRSMRQPATPEKLDSYGGELEILALSLALEIRVVYGAWPILQPHAAEANTWLIGYVHNADPAECHFRLYKRGPQGARDALAQEVYRRARARVAKLSENDSIDLTLSDS